MSQKFLIYSFLISSLFFTTCTRIYDCPKKEPDTCILPSLSNGLVAFFPFSGNTNDESGLDNYVKFNNATLTTDRNNKPNNAYQFNGVNSYMRIANSPSLNPQKISLCAIIKPTGYNSSKHHSSNILYKGFRDQDIYNVYFMRFTDGPGSTNTDPDNPAVDTLHQSFYTSFAGNVPPLKPSYVQTNRWYSIVYTYDGSVANFYIDGNLISSINSSIAYIPGNLDLFIGRTDNPLFPYWYNGVIDELRIYNRALSSAEVQSFGSACKIK